MCRNADVNVGPLPIPACKGHRDHNGGGKPPPSTVPPVRNSSALEGSEWATFYHCSV